MRRPRFVVPAVVGLLCAALAAGCSSAPSSPATAPSPAASPSTTAPATPSVPAATSPTEAPSATPPEEPTEEPAEDPAADLPPVRRPLSLPAIMRRPLDAGPIRRGAIIESNDAYVRRAVTYRSDGLTISGILLRPTGPGPFPGVVLNHGYIDPDVYVSGQGLAREQDWLARAGFAVLHTDYRGHAGSDPATRVDRESRLGYARDAANAAVALADESFVDGARMAMLGRSMGGGVTQNVLVAYPDLVDAAIVYASVSSSFVDNLRQFTEPNRPAELDAYYRRFGTPRESPGFYRGLSPRTFFDRIEAPVLLHHGTADSTCPFGWSVTTERLMSRAGVDARLVAYRGEEHAFVPQWQDSIERSVRFLRRRL